MDESSDYGVVSVTGLSSGTAVKQAVAWRGDYLSPSLSVWPSRSAQGLEPVIGHSFHARVPSWDVLETLEILGGVC